MEDSAIWMKPVKAIQEGLHPLGEEHKLPLMLTVACKASNLLADKHGSSEKWSNVGRYSLLWTGAL